MEWTKTEVPPNVLLAMSKAVRSIERGMGATVLKDCFQMEDLIKIGDFRKEMPKPVETDAIFPVYMVLLGTWWFTRGIEASAAKRRDVRLATAVNEVSWNLPASKRDPKALGEERTHGCFVRSCAPVPCALTIEWKNGWKY